jgi:hypothetical protein
VTFTKDYSSSTSAEVKNAWRVTYTSPEDVHEKAHGTEATLLLL